MMPDTSVVESAGAARTKMVWTLSPQSFSRPASELAESVVSIGASAVLTVFVPERESQYHELRKELDKLLKKNAVNGNEANEVALMFSLVGRRAFAFWSEKLPPASKGDTFEVRVVHDRLACLNRTDPAGGGAIRVAVTSEDMVAAVQAGVRLAVGYGDAVLEVEKVVESSANAAMVLVRVLVSGALENGMDVTSNAFARGVFPLTPADAALLKGALYEVADAVVAHGASRGEDLLQMRECFGARTQTQGGVAERVPPLLLCRVDSPKAMRAMNESFDVIDGVFLNRSELGVGVDLHDLPYFQKSVIARCNREGKIVIAASDLLSSMKKNSTPTRAEVSDIANLMLDGVDGVALGREVTEGPHALLAARYCQDTLANSEASLAREWRDVEIEVETDLDAIAQCSFHAAQRVGAKAIVCLTRRGYTAARLSSLRPPVDIVAITYNARAKRQMNLMSGVRALVVENNPSLDDMFASIKPKLEKEFGFQKGDKVVFVSLSSSQVARRGSNLFLIEEFK
jgi:pyruvate kinase